MTPYEIEVMLWYYSRCDDHEHTKVQPPAWNPTISAFLNCGMLELTPPETKRNTVYSITDKGRAYVEHLCAVQVPIVQWVQPPRADRIAAVLADGVEEG